MKTALAALLALALTACSPETPAPPQDAGIDSPDGSCVGPAYSSNCETHLCCAGVCCTPAPVGAGTVWPSCVGSPPACGYCFP